MPLETRSVEELTAAALGTEADPAHEDTPEGRVAAACEGKPPRAYVEVLAMDVLSLCARIPDAKRTDVTRAQAKGAAIAVRRLPESMAAVRTLHAEARDMLAVLEAARDHAQ